MSGVMRSISCLRKQWTFALLGTVVGAREALLNSCNYWRLGLAPAHQSGSLNMQQAAAPKVSFVSLGCPKALVDSERIITRLRAEGYQLARKHHGADLVIV